MMNFLEHEPTSPAMSRKSSRPDEVILDPDLEAELERFADYTKKRMVDLAGELLSEFRAASGSNIPRTPSHPSFQGGRAFLLNGLGHETSRNHPAQTGGSPHQLQQPQDRGRSMMQEQCSRVTSLERLDEVREAGDMTSGPTSIEVQVPMQQQASVTQGQWGHNVSGVSQMSSSPNRSKRRGHSDSPAKKIVGNQERRRTRRELRTQQSLHSGDHVPNWAKQEILALRQKRAKSARFASRLGLTTEQFSTTVSLSKDIPGEHKMLEIMSLFMIALNCAIIPWEMDFTAREEPLPTGLRIASLAFAAYFTLELIYRFWLTKFHPIRFLLGRGGNWRMVDIVVVMVLWIDQIFAAVSASPYNSNIVGRTSIVNVARLWRLWRMRILLKYLKILTELRLILTTLRVSVRSMISLALLTALSMFCAAIVLASGTLHRCTTANEKVKAGDDFCKLFGSLSAIQLTLAKAALGGSLWGEVLDVFDIMPLPYQVCLMACVFFAIIVLINLGIAVLVETMVVCKRTDIEVMMWQNDLERSTLMKRISEIFNEIDANQSGAISKAKLELALEDEYLSSILRCFQLATDDAHLLFELLDRDQSGFLDVEEFIAGCLKMRGPAQAIDIMRAHLQINKMSQDIANMENLTASIQVASGRDERFDRRMAAQPSQNDGFEPTLSEPQMSISFEKGSTRNTNFSDGASWNGVRIPKVEERAMVLRELRALRSQVTHQYTSWKSQRSGRSVPLKEVNMYDVCYNLVCPQTLPLGAELEGLDLSEVAPDEDMLLSLEGTMVTQDSQSSNMRGPQAVGRVTGVTASGALQVKVIKGQFMQRSGEHEEETCPGVRLGNDILGPPVNISKPISLSYKELVSTEAAAPAWYCCHWWGESICDFIACIEAHHKLRGEKMESAYWICAFANSQHDLGIEIADDPEKSSFRKAMQVARGVLLLLDHEATPFQRIWCDYELYKTVLDDSKDLDIVTMGDDPQRRQTSPQILAELPGESAVAKTRRESFFPIGVLARAISAKLEDGEATVMKDKERILYYMRQQRPGDGEDAEDAVVVANKTLNAFFAWAAFPQAVQRGLVRNFASFGGSDGRLALPEVTRLDDSRQKLVLSLAGFQDVTDSTMQDIVRGLPHQLVTLDLSFEGCLNVTDKGLTRLARGLGGLEGTLLTLHLDFLGCQHVTDVGLENLAKALPSSVQRLRLDFAKCSAVGMVGLGALARNLPQDLKVFSATFKGTQIDRNVDSADELRKLVRSHNNSHWKLPRLSLQSLSSVTG